MVLSVNERTFTQEVLKSSIPVLVNFSAPWCGLCRAINPQLLKFQAKWGEGVKIVSINADDNFKLAHTYRLTTLPTLILFEDGQVLHRLDRFGSRDDISSALDTISISCGEIRQRTWLSLVEYQTYQKNGFKTPSL